MESKFLMCSYCCEIFKSTSGERFCQYCIEIRPELECFVFTCTKCKEKDECQFAFDMYNEDGDCLMEK